MKPPILIGIVIAVIILAAGLLAPMFSSGKVGVEAREQALRAQADLRRYSPQLDLLTERVDAARLTEQPDALAAVSDQIGEQLQKTTAEYNRLVNEAKKLAEQSGLHPLTAPPAPAAQSALGTFQRIVKENEQLLDNARKITAEAARGNPQVLGVAQTQGLAEYMRAVGLLEEASRLRSQQELAQARLLDLASQWKQAQGYLDHYRGLDVDPILAQLKQDIREIAAMREEANAALADLTAQVQDREQTLAGVVKQLEAATAALRDLEAQSFTAGDDASFEQYRARYAALAEQVRDLQEQEQQLRHGGRQGAELVGDDAASAAVQGGTEVIGLEELQRRLATAKERARRLDSGHVSLEEHQKYVLESGQAAQREIARFQERVADLAASQKTAVEEIAALASRAAEVETQALAAADAAVRAFKQSQSATDTWLRAVSQTKSEKDPKGQNLRLALLTKDPYLPQIPRAAEAAARVLAGRIHAQRAEGSERVVASMGVFAEMNPEFEFDAAPFQEQAATARSAGLETLNTARDQYTSIADKLGAQPTAWVPQGALAAVYQLLARIEPQQAAAHTAQASEMVQRALEKREQSPFTQHLVAFREHFSGTGAPPAPAGTTDDPNAQGEFFLNN